MPPGNLCRDVGRPPFFVFGSSGNVAEFKGKVVQHGSKKKVGARKKMLAQAKKIEASLPDDARQRLRRLSDTVGITGLFDVIVTADDVVHSKPAPDLYLRAMEVLGVRPEDCIVYEDSEIGIASARAAGISAVIDIRRVTAP